MDMIKPYSRRSFWLIFLFMALLAGAMAGALYYGKLHITQEMSHLPGPDASPGQTSEELMSRVHQLHDTYVLYLIAISAGLLFLWSIILWLVLRRTAKKVLRNAGPAKSKASTSPKKSQKEREKQRQIENMRLFLHLLVVLQREGRLLDFFQEDLDLYEDEQIGAAVRDIHANCKKIMTKSLAMEPIVDGSEGDEIDVETGFDPDAIKLTGRVTGEPPFKGVIRHKGWRAKKMDLPDLSAVKDPAILSPAEVEIE